MRILTACSVVSLLSIAWAGLQAPRAGAAGQQALRGALQAKFDERHRAGSFPAGTAGFVLGDGSAFGLAVGVPDRVAGTPMKIVDGSLMDDLLDGVPAKLGPETKYGLGVIIRPTAYGPTYGHSGFMPASRPMPCTSRS